MFKYFFILGFLFTMFVEKAFACDEWVDPSSGELQISGHTSDCEYSMLKNDLSLSDYMQNKPDDPTLVRSLFFIPIPEAVNCTLCKKHLNEAIFADITGEVLGLFLNKLSAEDRETLKELNAREVLLEIQYDKKTKSAYALSIPKK